MCLCFALLSPYVFRSSFSAAKTATAEHFTFPLGLDLGFGAVMPFGIFQYQNSQIWYFLNSLVLKIWQIYLLFGIFFPKIFIYRLVFKILKFTK